MSLLAKSGGGWVGPWHPVSVAWYLGASGSLEVVGSGEREGTGFSVLRVSHLLAIGKLKKKKKKKKKFSSILQFTDFLFFFLNCLLLPKGVLGKLTVLGFPQIYKPV